MATLADFMHCSKIVILLALRKQSLFGWPLCATLLALSLQLTYFLSSLEKCFLLKFIMSSRYVFLPTLFVD